MYDRCYRYCCPLSCYSAAAERQQQLGLGHADEQQGVSAAADALALVGARMAQLGDIAAGGRKYAERVSSLSCSRICPGLTAH